MGRAWPHSVDAFRTAARRRLPKPQFEFVDGGADDEVTLRANREAFDEFRLVPRAFTNVVERDLSTTLAGVQLKIPIITSPAGQVGLVHPDGELGAVLGARAAGTFAIVSGAGTYSIEEVVAAAPSPGWFNLFPWRDREFRQSMLDRAAAAGFTGLCITLDTAVPGNRERDVINGWVAPPRLTAHAFEYARHPRWVFNVLHHRRGTARNFDAERPPLRKFIERSSLSARLATRTLVPDLDLNELESIRHRWKGPLALKGAFSPADVRRAVNVGVDVFLIGNHGGRQLDGLQSALEQLPSIVDAVGNDAEIVVDGGVRRGTDIIKALCLGARAVSIGRPWVWGLAVGGKEGVAAVLETLERELDRSMALLGCRSVRELDRSFLARRGFAGGADVDADPHAEAELAF